jgi:hypothetical protein
VETVVKVRVLRLFALWRLYELDSP